MAARVILEAVSAADSPIKESVVVADKAAIEKVEITATAVVAETVSIEPNQAGEIHEPAALVPERPAQPERERVQEVFHEAQVVAHGLIRQSESLQTIPSPFEAVMLAPSQIAVESETEFGEDSPATVPDVETYEPSNVEMNVAETDSWDTMPMPVHQLQLEVSEAVQQMPEESDAPSAATDAEAVVISQLAEPQISAEDLREVPFVAPEIFDIAGLAEIENDLNPEEVDTIFELLTGTTDSTASQEATSQEIGIDDELTVGLEAEPGVESEFETVPMLTVDEVETEVAEITEVNAADIDSIDVLAGADVQEYDQVLTDAEPAVSFAAFVAEEAEEFEPLASIEAIRLEVAEAAEPVPLEEALSMLASTLSQDLPPITPEPAEVADEVVIEVSSVQVIETAEFVQDELDPEQAAMAVLIREIYEELYPADESNPDQSQKHEAVITKQLAAKLIVLLRALGYERPNDTLRDFLERYELDYLLQAIHFLYQLTNDNERHEVLVPDATGDPAWQDDDATNRPLAARIGNAVMMQFRDMSAMQAA